MEIGLHALEHQVDVLVILSSEHIVQLNDVGVVHFVKEGDFSESSLCICGMLESIENLLESHLIFGLLVDGFPHVAISPAANLLEELIPEKDVLLDFLGHV